MNLRVSLLLVAVLALVAGAFAISWDDSRAPRTAGPSAPAHQTLAQALPQHKQIVQAKPPAPELAPAMSTPAEIKTANADAAPATESKPVIAAEQPKGERVDVANAPAETPAQDATPVVTATPSEPATPTAAKPADTQPAPVVTAPPANEKPAMAAPAEQKPAPVVAPPPAQTEQPTAAKPVDEKPTPVVTAPPPATDEPAMAEPADQKPAPVVTAPPAQTENPAAATTPAPAPTVAAPTPPEKPVIVMTPLPEKRPDTSAAALEKNRPAKYLFGAKKLPSNGRTRAIGYYPKGCLAGGVELPVDGPNWQAMRLSRNRNWGHPDLVRFLENFAPAAAKATGWPGVLIGDLSQPRGGPTPFGHRSHQTGLDVDIWFMPMPEKRLSRQQRETISATHLVASNGKELDPKTWTPETADFIRVAAEQPGVERVLVNAAIKKELCRLQGKKRWPWMAKVRPWYGHDDHIHVRLECPADSPHCRSQPDVPGGDGCSNKELAFWFSDRVLGPKRPEPAKKRKPAKQIMLADLPDACKVVLNAPAKKSHLASDRR